MKYLAALLAMVAWVSLWGQGTAQKFNGEALTKADFKATPPKNAGNRMAEASLGIKYDLRQTNANTLQITVTAVFDKKESFFMPEATDYILNHEQVHFYITELFARKMRQQIALLNTCNISPKKVAASVKTIYYNLFKEYTTYQDLYDTQTNHSINTSTQTEWDTKIPKELAALAAYQSPTVSLSLSKCN